MAQKNPTEICTIARAQQLGIYNGDEAPYKPNAKGDKYDDLRTYNDDTDNQQNRTKSLCKDSLDGASSSRNCVDQYGPGFSRKPNDNGTGYKCTAYDCPPGFIKQGSVCKKPLADAEIDKRARCDERWYDWFVTPNYHLGNTVYSSNLGECYAPCDDYNIPAYAKDPVDDSSLDLVTNENLGKCIPRDKYFYGKYKIGSDYCPLSWIHRLNATKDSISKELSDTYSTFYSSNMTTTAFSQYANNPAKIQVDAGNIMKQCSRYYDNIDVPTDSMQNACNGLNTPERVQRAYNWCAELYDNEDEYRQRIIRESGDSTHIDRKVSMMKQACNSVFCNENDTALSYITDDQICFPPPPNIDPGTGEIISEDDQPDPEAPNTKESQSFVQRSLRWFILIILYPALFIIFLFMWKNYIYPNIIRPFWQLIAKALGRDKREQELINGFIKVNAEKAHVAARARLTQ
jgi:hypothetical protein